MTGKENNMEVIRNSEFGGERPLFESHNLRLENVIIRAGESAIKECSNIEAVDCRFEGNYPFVSILFSALTHIIHKPTFAP